MAVLRIYGIDFKTRAHTQHRTHGLQYHNPPPPHTHTYTHYPLNSSAYQAPELQCPPPQVRGVEEEEEEDEEEEEEEEEEKKEM